MIYDRQWHAALGRHSRIPECCIEYFLECWERKQRTRYDLGVYYVRCPRCVATDNLADLHHCTPECSFQREIREYWGVTNDKERVRWQPVKRGDRKCGSG